MTTSEFKKGEMVRCITPDPFGHFLKEEHYKVLENTTPHSDYVKIAGEDKKRRTMFKSRFAPVLNTYKEFTDEEYEGLLV